MTNYELIELCRSLRTAQKRALKIGTRTAFDEARIYEAQLDNYLESLPKAAQTNLFSLGEK